MGYGQYSHEAHVALTEARGSLGTEAIFKGNTCDPTMDPLGVVVRESRDSEAHPESIGMVFALDVSGSMGTIPHGLATRTLPSFMRSVRAIVPDPQILFIAIGNGYSDRSPLQVGQFESEAALMDQWLARLHLEGAGGGMGESYDLAMYFAARHTSMDCVEKRGRKGYFFMTGDELPFTCTSVAQVRTLIGDSLQAAIDTHTLAEELQGTFHTFFLIPDAARAQAHNVRGAWEWLFHERCIVLPGPDDTAAACAVLVGIQEGILRDAAAVAAKLEEIGWTGAARDAVVASVLPFLQALQRGPIGAPRPLRPVSVPGVSG